MPDACNIFTPNKKRHPAAKLQDGGPTILKITSRDTYISPDHLISYFYRYDYISVKYYCNLFVTLCKAKYLLLLQTEPDYRS